MKQLHSDIEYNPGSSTLTALAGRKIVFQLQNYWKHLQLFSRNVWLYLIGSFLIGLTYSSYLLLMNLYLREIGTSESFIGRVLSGGAMGTAVMAIPAALILRQVRLKTILITSTIVSVFAILVLTQLPIGNALIALSFLAGMAMTFYRVAAGPFFMRNSSDEERTYIFSISFGVTILAGMIGSLIFGKLVAILGTLDGGMVSAYRWVFILAVGLGLLAILPFSKIKAADPDRSEKGSNLSLALLRRRLNLYTRLFLPHFLVGTGAGLIIPFLNIYFRDRFELTPDIIGYFYFAVNATMFLGILAGPVLVRKMGMIRAIVITQLLSMPFMVILAFTYSVPVAFAAFLIRGALMNLGVPIGSNFSMEMVDKSEQALVNALLMLSWTGAWMVSTAVGGLLIEKYGYTLPLLIAVALYFISSISYYLFFRKSEIKTVSGYKIEVIHQ
jgi:predicted MFS family arabinose efflux permease